MKITKKLQEGGTAPAASVQQPTQQAAPQGEDPMVQLVQLAQQAIQGQDCEAAMAVCEGFLQLV